MKSLFYTMLCAASIGTACLFTACGSNDPASQVDNIIAEAEKAIPLETSPSLGNIPSLQLQYKAADKLLEELVEQREQEVDEKFKGGGSMEDAMRQIEIIKDERKTMEAELKKAYTERIMGEAQKMEGTTIASRVDGVQYSKATAKLVCAKDSSIQKPLEIEAELVLAKPFGGYTPYCSWEFQDAQGQKITAGAYTKKEWKELKAGDKLTQCITLSMTGKNAMKLKQLYFKE